MIKFRVKAEESQPVDDNDLIRLVKLHEFLYNTKNPDYRNLPQRAVIWGSIAKELGISDRKFWKRMSLNLICLQTNFSFKKTSFRSDGKS